MNEPDDRRDESRKATYGNCGAKSVSWNRFHCKKFSGNSGTFLSDFSDLSVRKEFQTVCLNHLRVVFLEVQRSLVPSEESSIVSENRSVSENSDDVSEKKLQTLCLKFQSIFCILMKNFNILRYNTRRIRKYFFTSEE